MKPYYRDKGKYKDGRRRVCVEWRDNTRTMRTIALPKPEKMIIILDRLKNDKITKEKTA